MEDIIRKMLDNVNKYHDEEMANMVYELLSQFASTFNCPSN